MSSYSAGLGYTSVDPLPQTGPHSVAPVVRYTLQITTDEVSQSLTIRQSCPRLFLHIA